tara:strand:- start:326 stop:1327 length:1002 start_codon:yes stop_codon:yes gene_type:complete
MGINKRLIGAGVAAEQAAVGFNTIAYSGNSNSNRSFTGLGFQPDIIWIKGRNNSEQHYFYDSTRGSSKFLHTNLTSAEGTDSTTRLKSFNADGFTLGNDPAVNGNNNTYIAWCWKVNGGTTSSNTDGTNIDSTVQVNTDLGMSIVQFTTPSTYSGSNTVGHGLGSAPDMIIVKATSTTEDWYVYHSSTGLNKAMRLNSNIAAGNATYLFGTVNSTVFNPAYTSTSPITNIAYCFQNVTGFQYFGSYSGTGSSNSITGLGFSPDWVILKSSTSAENWAMFDTSRGSNVLYANESSAESAFSTFTFDSDGFTVPASSGMTNGSGETYIYWAAKIN